MQNRDNGNQNQTNGNPGTGRQTNDDELTDAELERASGGHRDSSDPAQMFQQILQQLTQGQG
jgi:hypothetical protein